jgi:hypothetical protein
LSLFYRDQYTGGKLYQAGVREIPQILRDNNISLLILAAREYQPKHISGTRGRFSLADKIYVPLRDTVLFTPKEFKNTVKRAKSAAEHAVDYISRGKNVLSTCQAGWNRSGIISGLALVDLTGIPGKQVVRHIRKKRSSSALSNPLFASVVANS